MNSDGSEMISRVKRIYLKENKKEKIERVFSLDQSVLEETNENSESLLYFIKDKK